MVRPLSRPDTLSNNISPIIPSNRSIGRRIVRPAFERDLFASQYMRRCEIPGQSQVWLDQQDDRIADGGESVGSPAQPSAWMAAGWPGGKPEPTYTSGPVH
jgi:hypothetical protein